MDTSPASSTSTEDNHKAPRAYWFALGFISMGVTMVMMISLFRSLTAP